MLEDSVPRLPDRASRQAINTESCKLGRVPSQKGVSVLPVVIALKRHPDGRKLVPPRLWKYFDEHLVVSGWYPATTGS